MTLLLKKDATNFLYQSNDINVKPSQILQCLSLSECQFLSVCYLTTYCAYWQVNSDISLLYGYISIIIVLVIFNEDGHVNRKMRHYDLKRCIIFVFGAQKLRFIITEFDK